MPQRLTRHHRPQVGAADTDVHDSPNRLAGVAEPTPLADVFGTDRHSLKHGMHIWHHVVAIEKDFLRLGGPQGHMQHRPALRRVDPLAAKHRLSPFGHPARAGELHEELLRLVGEPLFGIVEVETAGFGGQPRAAIRVGLEQFPQRRPAKGLCVCRQRLPGG